MMRKMKLMKMMMIMNIDLLIPGEVAAIMNKK